MQHIWKKKKQRRFWLSAVITYKFNILDGYLSFNNSVHVFMILLLGTFCLFLQKCIDILIEEFWSEWRDRKTHTVTWPEAPPLSTEGIKSPALSLFIRDPVYMTPGPPSFCDFMWRSLLSFLQFWILVSHRKKKTFWVCSCINKFIYECLSKPHARAGIYLCPPQDAGETLKGSSEPSSALSERLLCSLTKDISLMS